MVRRVLITGMTGFMLAALCSAQDSATAHTAADGASGNVSPGAGGSSQTTTTPVPVAAAAEKKSRRRSEQVPEPHRQHRLQAARQGAVRPRRRRHQARQVRHRASQPADADQHLSRFRVRGARQAGHRRLLVRRGRRCRLTPRPRASTRTSSPSSPTCRRRRKRR